MDKRIGQFFTPSDVSNLTSKLLIKKIPNKNKITIFDNSFGKGNLLISAYEQVKKQSCEKTIKVYGCELDAQTGIYAKRYFRSIAVETKNLKYADILETDVFDGKKFDYSIINPPYGLSTVERNIRSELTHFQSIPRDAQLLFINDAINHSGRHSRIAAIVSETALTGGRFDSPSSRIRLEYLKNDILEAIIKLPHSLFEDTPITTYILIFDKSKDEIRKGKIQLIDASKCCEKVISSNFKKHVINDDYAETIISVYNDFKNFENDCIVSKIISSNDLIYLNVRVVMGNKIKTCTIPSSLGIGTFLRKYILTDYPNAKIKSEDVIEGCSFNFDKQFEDNPSYFKRSLGDVADFIQGYHFNKEDFGDDNTYPVVKVSNILDDKIDYESCSKVNIDNEVVRKYLIHKNDILIALSGSNAGKIAFVDEEPTTATYANQRVGIIRTFDIDPLELFEKIKSGIDEWSNINASNSVIKNINSNVILDFEL